MLLASWLLLRGLRYGRARDFALGGACVSLATMDYYSGRIGPVLAVGLAGLWFWQRHQFPHVRFKLWWIGFGGALVVFGPNLAYLIDEFQRFSGRGNHVLIWTDEAWRHLSLKYQSDGSVWIVLKEQILRAALAPFYFPDESTICYLRRPMLGAVAAAGLMLGLGFCVRRWRQPACAFPVFSVVAVLVLGGVLTIDPPYWPHLNIAVPALCLIAAIGIERLARRVHEALPPRASSAVPSLVVFCLIATAVHEWEVYEEFARRHAGGRIHAVREIQQLPAGSRVYLVSNAVRADQESFRFLTPHVSVRNLSPRICGKSHLDSTRRWRSSSSTTHPPRCGDCSSEPTRDAGSRVSLMGGICRCSPRSTPIRPDSRFTRRRGPRPPGDYLKGPEAGSQSWPDSR